MRPKVAVIYNEPVPSRYDVMGEEKAILSVLDAVAAVYDALIESGYPATKVPLLPPLDQVKTRLSSLETDVVFNLFEGFNGAPETEITVANFLSELGFTFTGCEGKTLALALDKAKTKELLLASGISTARYQLLTPETLSSFKLTYPCIVKPSAEDASHGLSEDSLVNNFTSLEKQVKKVCRLFGGKALVEEFIGGREFNATVLSNGEFTVLPISEIVYSLPPGKPKILTFAAKWEPDSPYFQGTQAVCPAEIDDELKKRLAQTARTTFKTLGCQGYARVDMRLDGEGEVKVLEVNPNPDISPGTGAARQAKAAGMTYNEFIELIVSLALKGRVQCN
ncbi:MAG: ATP-grasp domain-containing protein [Chloroflexota bacterium]